MQRPIYVDAIRFHFLNTILFDPTLSGCQPASDCISDDAGVTQLAVSIPVPKGYPVPTAQWGGQHVDEIIDFWIDTSALPLLGQCCDWWDQLPHGEAIQEIAADAQRYVAIRAQLVASPDHVRASVNPYCENVTTFFYASPVCDPDIEMDSDTLVTVLNREALRLVVEADPLANAAQSSARLMNKPLG
ncbi:hypothetical protein [Marinobacterium sp. BA1]|uniref:hypothetical protein n=1 Tax=Marinobacterium sp. BA1 TaxID=3138931 RepID=UPI0032E719BC